MISVIIPVYNVEKYLRECIDSVLRQTYAEYEIILVDDGSTDSSGLICDEYSKTSEKVRVIHQKNGGLSAARNTGLRAATGEYIYFLDSDDYIEDCCLEHLLKCATENNSDAVFFDGRFFYDECEDDGNTYSYIRTKKYRTDRGKVLLRQLLLSDEYRTVVPLMFYKRKYLEDNNLTFMEGILHEDELFTFLVFIADGMISHCHKQLYQRRIRPGSIMTASKMVRRFDSMLKIYQYLEHKYSAHQIDGKASDMYMIRMAKSVWGRYQNLENQDKAEREKEYQSFRKNVLSHNGYGDIKLKIKCSDGVRNVIYRGEYKLIRLFKRG